MRAKDRYGNQNTTQFFAFTFFSFFFVFFCVCLDSLMFLTRRLCLLKEKQERSSFGIFNEWHFVWYQMGNRPLSQVIFHLCMNYSRSTIICPDSAFFFFLIVISGVMVVINIFFCSVCFKCKRRVVKAIFILHPPTILYACTIRYCVQNIVLRNEFSVFFCVFQCLNHGCHLAE